MATIKEIQDQINNNTFDPNKLNSRQKQAVDEAIRRGLITGPSMSELETQRAGAAKDVATIDEAVKNPIGVRLQQQDSSLDGRSEAVLAGDLIGSITPYVAMRKKIFSAAKSKVPGDKSTGLFARTKMFSNFSDKLTARLPGRFKLLGGLTKLLAKVADPTVGRVLAVGNLAYKDLDKFPNGKWCDVGDYVCYGKHAGQKLYYKATRLILLFDDQVILKVEDPKDLDPTFNLTRGSN